MKRSFLIFLFSLLSYGATDPNTRLSVGIKRKPIEQIPPALWVRDPFYVEPDPIKLSGIISKQMAYINGKWFKVGDEIGEYRIHAILENCVLVTHYGTEITLTLEN